MGAEGKKRGTVVRINSTKPADVERILRRAPADIEKALRAEASLNFQGVHYEHGMSGWDEMDMDVVVVNGEHLLILQNHKEGH